MATYYFKNNEEYQKYLKAQDDEYYRNIDYYQRVEEKCVNYGIGASILVMLATVGIAMLLDD